MASTLDVLEELLSLSAEAQVPLALWEQVIRALARLPPDLERGRLDRLFDRCLDERPADLYRNAYALKPQHRPVLLEALERCTDREAQLLRRAGLAAFDDAARLLRVLVNGKTSTGVIAAVAKITPPPLAVAVLDACTEIVSAGYPPMSHYPFAGMFGAVMIFGTLAQAEKVLSVAPPEHAVGWLRVASKAMPTERATLVRKRIEGMPHPGYTDVIDAALAGDPTTRYRRLEAAPAPTAAPKRPAAPAPTPPASAASGNALLAAIYAAPEDDAPRAVYADWLLGRGEPLGELIQLQLARAAGKKGTVGREKLLLEQGRGDFWGDHPSTWFGVQWEWLERGFPAKVVFSHSPTDAVRARLRANPAWATVRELDCNGDPRGLDGVTLPAMPLLVTARRITRPALAVLADAAPPLETLGLHLDERPPESLRTDFGQLRQLSVRLADATAWPISGVIDWLAAVGLLRQITELALSCETDLGTMLDVFRALPGSVRTFRLHIGGGSSGIRIERTAGAPSLGVVVDKFSIDALLSQLHVLDPARVGTVKIELDPKGYFTKKSAPVAEERIAEVVARFS